MAKVAPPPAGHYDEMLGADGQCRAHYQPYGHWLNDTSVQTLNSKRRKADLLFHRVGITFNVYGDAEGAERLIPFDAIPRIIPGDEWRQLKKGVDESEIETFFDYIMERSQLFLGAVSSTVLRNDVHRFITVGTAIERADNTARMLDVKYQVMKAQRKDSDRATDFYHWSALLRALSAFEAYHVVYGDQITAEQVAELLILRSDLPRSLRACVSLLAATLPLIEGEAGLEAKRLAAELHAQLRYGDIEYCFAKGLHDYLGEFLQRINGIAVAIHHAYLEAA